MSKKSLFLFLFFFTLHSVQTQAQIRPLSGRPLTITFVPPESNPLASADSLQLVYVFDFWGSRYGTRMALFENVLHPTPERVQRATFLKTDLGWKATIDIPEKAALLSYYITDGTYRDDNGERTYSFLVYGDNGKPVRNAHYLMTPILEMGRAPLSDRAREAELEIIEYPDNFRAYFQFFTLMFEQEKGGESVQKKIIDILTRLESRYPDDLGVLNLEARTYFYIFRDVEKALAYKSQIDAPKQWPEVFIIFDREAKQEEERRKQLETESTRKALIGSVVPDVAFNTFDVGKKPIREEKGKILVLLFWGSTSEQSKMLLPYIKKLHEKYAGAGVKVIAVNLDLEKETAERFLAEHPYSFEHVFNNGDALQRLAVDGIPQLFLIDKEQVVRDILVGFSMDNVGKLEAFIKKLVK